MAYIEAMTEKIFYMYNVQQYGAYTKNISCKKEYQTCWIKLKIGFYNKF